jgi:hypothetical protein
MVARILNWQFTLRFVACLIKKLDGVWGKFKPRRNEIRRDCGMENEFFVPMKSDTVGKSWRSGKSRLDDPFSNRSLPSHCFDGKKASTVTNQF